MDPFAPPPPSTGPSATPSAGPSGSGSPCPGCGQPYDPSTASYDERGRLVCRACLGAQAASAASATIETRDPSTTRNLYGAAAASAGLGAMSCCISGLGSWFFLVTPLPIFSGFATIVLCMRDPTIKTKLGAGYWAVLGLSLAGIVFGGLGTAIGILSLAMTIDR